MDDNTKRKLVAGGKVVAGGARMLSGAATALGVGILGTFLRQHNMRVAAIQIGRKSVEGGEKMLENGLSELKQ